MGRLVWFWAETRWKTDLHQKAECSVKQLTAALIANVKALLTHNLMSKYSLTLLCTFANNTLHHVYCQINAFFHYDILDIHCQLIINLPYHKIKGQL